MVEKQCECYIMNEVNKVVKSLVIILAFMGGENMKTMAKILSLVLAFSMLPLAACSGGVDSAVSSEAASTASKKPVVSAASRAESGSASSVLAEPENNDYSKQTYKIAESLEKLKINGRYAVTNAGEAGGYAKSISFDNTAALISFNADCEGDVSLTMTVETLINDVDVNKHFLVVVDGVEERKFVTGQKGMTVKVVLDVAKGLKRGNHTFEVYRKEAEYPFL